jgi:hypothetical protein
MVKKIIAILILQGSSRSFMSAENLSILMKNRDWIEERVLTGRVLAGQLFTDGNQK